MSTFTVERFMLLSVCFYATQQVINAEGNSCTTPKLGPKDTLLITIFENGSPIIDGDGNIWANLCRAIVQFPKERVKLEYRPGALATGTTDNIECGSEDCKYDQISACHALHSKHYREFISVVIAWFVYISLVSLTNFYKEK